MFPARLTQLIAVCIFFLFALTTPVSALATSAVPNTDPDAASDMHTSVQVILIEVSSAMLCQLTGIDIVNPAKPCLGVDRTTNKIGYAENETEGPRLGGAIGTMVGMIGMTYNIPIHTIDYTNYVASNFGVVKSAYAQGTGFDNLTSLMGLWTKIRDLSYLAFVLIFVIIGFAIMLRIKLDPRTVMTIQNQIPRVIIAILLITFSYAIAGLLIDLMWVTTYMGINVLTANAGNCKNNTPLSQVATLKLLNPPIQYVAETLGCLSYAGTSGAIGDLASNVGGAMGEILSRVILALFGVNAPTDCSLFNISTLGSCVLNGIIRFVVGVIAALAIIIAIFVQLMRIWFALIKTYILLIFYTLLSPIWILLGLVPGTKDFGFASWIRHMLFALSVYPATVFLFVVAVVLANDPTINNPINTLGFAFVPPLIANPEITNSMGYILALGAILISPQIIDMMREIFKTPPSKHGQAIFAAAALGQGAIAAPVTKTWGSLMARDQTGAAKGPLAFAMDTFVGNRIRGTAMKYNILTRAWNKRYAGTTGKEIPDKKTPPPTAEGASETTKGDTGGTSAEGETPPAEDSSGGTTS